MPWPALASAIRRLRGCLTLAASGAALAAIIFATAVAPASASSGHKAQVGARMSRSSQPRHRRRRGHAASKTTKKKITVKATIASPPSSASFRAAPTGGLVPLSDAQAAALVVPAAENRPANSGPNHYMPTAAQLQTFRNADDSWGQSILVANPYLRYVTGQYKGTTDEIIQWAAQKWGIPADWLRAQYVRESDWHMSQLGDLATVTPAEYLEYPPQARVAGTDEVYESMGISQVKWIPDGSVGAGTEPLRWESTAFNVDYQAATVRFYYDNPGGARSEWGDSSYQPDQAWNSIGGWYEPYPWLNSGQLNYVSEVQAQLAAHPWTQSSF